ncbi:MAG: type II secretion system protein GspF, partial [Pseudomonadota bacterium]
MPAFEYEALDRTGRVKKGVVSADTPRLARGELRRLELTPVAISAAREGGENRFLGLVLSNNDKKIGGKDLVAITRQMAVLVEASTP